VKEFWAKGPTVSARFQQKRLGTAYTVISTNVKKPNVWVLYMV